MIWVINRDFQELKNWFKSCTKKRYFCCLYYVEAILVFQYIASWKWLQIFQIFIAQRRTISRNHALLAMYTNQVDLCKTLVNDLSSKFDDVSEDEKKLIVVGVLARSGKTDEAVNILLASNQRLFFDKHFSSWEASNQINKCVGD